MVRIVFETRFSYFGQSGWKSDASIDPELLYAPDRLERRFDLFGRITLPSLAAQTDPDFRYLVLSGKRMPQPFRERLTQMVGDHLGDRGRVIFREQGSAGRVFRRAIRNRFPAADTVAQVVLDDDDAVACDFAEICRREALQIEQSAFDERRWRFLSFARGASLVFENGQPNWLSDRYVPYTNLGLTLVAPASTRINPFMTSHRRIGERHPGVVISSRRPFYLRSIHADNDSRAAHASRRMRDRDAETVFRLFPFLRSEMPDPAQA